MSTSWNVKFLQLTNEVNCRHALIILNQPFRLPLLLRLWNSSQWHCCADGGANHLFDSFHTAEERNKYFPDLITGDLDSIRPQVREYYSSYGVPVIQDNDQDSTDLMKCVAFLRDKEALQGSSQYDIIFLGGLSGRLDQTIHTLSYVHKLRKDRNRVFVVTDNDVGWVLDSGEHEIEIDHEVLGQTCGLLPVGIDYTVLSTSGLQWNLSRWNDRQLLISTYIFCSRSPIFIPRFGFYIKSPGSHRTHRLD